MANDNQQQNIDPIAWLQEERDKSNGQLTPDDLARFYAEQQRLYEAARRRAMNEGYAGGTTNVMQTTGNNPGMKLFMGKIKGVRPKLLVPHPSRARLPNAAQLDESVQTPLGIQKGSSGVLSTKQRKAMPKSSFAIPSKSPGSGSYPINDPSHARNALSRVSQFGSPAQKSQVRAAVHRKYPSIGGK